MNYNNIFPETPLIKKPNNFEEEKNIELLENKKKKGVIIMYLIGILLVFIQNYIIIIHSPKIKKIVPYIFVINVVILLANMYFSYNDELVEHEKEIGLYQYVEDNGRALLSASLAISIFLRVILQNNKNKTLSLYTIVIPIIISFIYAASVLTIVWMPKKTGYYIRLLRDLKTAFLTNSIFTLLTAMINILNVMK